MTEVVRWLYKEAVPGGADAVIFQNLLLRYGEASADFRKIVASLKEWMKNDHPTWAAYRALMVGRLIGLDKQTIVRPVRIVKMWRRCFVKCVLIYPY